MARFLARRIFEGIIVLWLVTVGVFIIFYEIGRASCRERVCLAV